MVGFGADGISAEIVPFESLLILCCFGGVPFIDYYSSNHLKSMDKNMDRHTIARMMDPTDWIATDLSGSLLNKTTHPKFFAANPQLATLLPDKPDLSLTNCDLFNLTFGSQSDKNLFDRFHGVLACRCPLDRYGRVCEYDKIEFEFISNRSLENQSLRSSSHVKTSTTTAPTTITTTTTTAVHQQNQKDNNVKPKITFERSSSSKKPIILNKNALLPHNEAAELKQSTNTLIMNKTLIQKSSTENPVSSSTSTNSFPFNASTSTSSILSQLPSTLNQNFSVSVTPKTTKLSSSIKLINLLMYNDVSLTLFEPQEYFTLNEAMDSENLTQLPEINQQPIAAGLKSSTYRISTSKSIYFLLFLLFIGLFVFKMMRGCFCDCFGGFKNPFDTTEKYDKPIDTCALNRCLEALTEARRPLITSISETCPPVYNTGNVVLPSSYTSQQQQRQQQINSICSSPSTIQPRTHSPPPSYHSLNGSIENLTVSNHQQSRNGR